MWWLLNGSQCVLLHEQMLIKLFHAGGLFIGSCHLSNLWWVSRPLLCLFREGMQQAWKEVHCCHAACGWMGLQSNKPYQKLNWEAESLQWKVGVPGLKHFLNMVAFAISVQEVGKQMLVLLLCTGGDSNAAGSSSSSTYGLNLAVAEAGRTRESELLTGCRWEGGISSGMLPGGPNPGSKG